MYEQRDTLKEKAAKALKKLYKEGFQKIKTDHDILRAIEKCETMEMTHDEIHEKSIQFAQIIGWYALKTTKYDIFFDYDNDSVILSNEFIHLNLQPILESCFTMNICSKYIKSGDLANLQKPPLVAMEEKYLKSLTLKLKKEIIKGEFLFRSYNGNSSLLSIKFGRGYSCGDFLWRKEVFFNNNKTDLDLLRSHFLDNKIGPYYLSIWIEFVALFLFNYQGFIFEEFKRDSSETLTHCQMRYGKQSIDVYSFIKNMLFAGLNSPHYKGRNLLNLLYDSYYILPRIYEINHNNQIIAGYYSSVQSNKLDQEMMASKYDYGDDYLEGEELERHLAGGIYASPKNNIRPRNNYTLFTEKKGK